MMLAINPIETRVAQRARLKLFQHCTLLACLLGGAAVLAQPAQVGAQAQPTAVYLRSTGVTVVGAAYGRAVAGTLTWFGCSWRDLGPATLTRAYALHGTAGDDTIHVVDGAGMYWCNRLLQPITQNGYAFEIYGGDGDDTLYGGGYAPFAGNPNTVYGERGNDVLYLGNGGVHGDGGPGNDLIYGTDNASDVLLGGDGNDILCEHADVQALTIDGGAGNDTACSTSAALNQFSGIETQSCLACGLGY